MHVNDVIYPKTLLLLTIGSSPSEWICTCRQILHSQAAFIQQAAFVKVTSVVMSQKDKKEMTRMREIVDVKEVDDVDDVDDVNETKAVAWLNSKCLDVLGIEMSFAGGVRSLQQLQPSYVNTTLMKDEELKLFEMNGSNHNFHMNMYCNISENEGTDDKKDGMDQDMEDIDYGCDEMKVLDRRLIGKYDRCWVRTNRPSVLLPKIQQLIRDGGWLIVSVQNKYTCIQNDNDKSGNGGVGIDDELQEVCQRLGWKCHSVATSFVEVNGVDENGGQGKVVMKCVDWLVVTPEKNGFATLRLPSCPCCQ